VINNWACSSSARAVGIKGAASKNIDKKVWKNFIAALRRSKVGKDKQQVGTVFF